MKALKNQASILAVCFITLFSLLRGIAHAQTVMYVLPAVLEIRSAPSLSADVISELSQNEKVTVDAVQNGWASVTIWSRKGYVPLGQLCGAGGGSPTQVSPLSRYDAPYSAPKQVPAKSTTYVLICNSENAYAYHAYTCNGLNRCTHGILKVSVDDAQDMGRVPCKICY